MRDNTERLGDAPIEEQYRQKMNFLAEQLDNFFNGELKGEDRTTGFCLMVFNFGDSGRANYISNASRADVVIMLKEQLKRFEGQPKVTGKACKPRPRDLPLPPANEMVLTRMEACRIARISLPTFDRAVTEKRLRINRQGRKITVSRAELNRYLRLFEGQPEASEFIERSD